MTSAMSTPPSDPRRSTSSQPSAASSHTLHSTASGPHPDPPELGPGKRRKVQQRADGSQAAPPPSADSNARPQGLLGADLAADRERESRRRLPRRSGGFLLDAALPGSSARRRSRENGAEEKGKLPWDRRRKSKSPASHDSPRRAYSRGSSSRSRPLSGDTEVLSAGEGSASQEHRERSPDTRPGLGINVDIANDLDEHVGQAPVNAGIDPAQIIHMALNLSESRRRNLAHGQLAAPVSRSRRATSSGLGMPTNTPMQGSFYDYGVGGSLKQHLQQQRAVSQNMSPHRLSTPASRHVSVSTPNSPFDAGLGPQHGYTFSAATLARAAKARTYVELGVEYRRLLHYLPLLKSDGESYTYSAFSSPGTPNVEIKRTPSRAGSEVLGRAYNPLQFIRNRKLRARERRQLDPDVNEFEDIDRVRNWIDTVEDATVLQSQRKEEKILLPAFNPGPRLQPTPEHQNGEGKTLSIFLGKQKRPRMDWFTLPSEFLADAVWLEQDGHKMLIEDRNGNRIFPSPRSNGSATRMSREQARPSLDRRRMSTAGSTTAGGPFSEPRTNYSSEAESQRGRKKRHFLHNHREESPDKSKRRAWISRGRSSSSSGLSSSDDDTSARRKKLDRRLSTQDENIGPLERHMKALAEGEGAHGVDNGLSPILSSPERYEKWGDGQSRTNTGLRVTSETESDADRGSRAAAQRATKRLTLSTSAPSRPSLDGVDSSAPNTPLTNTFSFGGSPPSSRVASPDRKPKKSKLPFFRSDTSMKGPKVDTTDFAIDHVSQKQPSGEPAEPGRLSVDQPRRTNSIKPGVLKSHRTNESLSSIASFQERKQAKERKELKEPGSAVTRFFKDVGREGSKARKFIFKKDRPPEEADEISSSDDESSASSDSDGELSKSVLRWPRSGSKAPTDAGLSDASDISERRPKYHAELPTFKSAAVQEKERESSVTPSERRRGRQRPSRSNRLSLPRLDTNVSRSSSPGVVQVHPKNNLAPERPHSVGPPSLSRSPSAHRRRISKLLEMPGGAGRVGLPPTSLSRIPPDRKYSGTSARPSPQRHWSISDQNSRRPSAVDISSPPTISATRTDIARIRALLLCSGIKAAELARRAHNVRDTPAPFLARAAEMSSTASPEEQEKQRRLIAAVSRKEEHVLAARILASDLAASNQTLVGRMQDFRTQRLNELHARCERLRIELGDGLTPRCHARADDADAFTREVTSGATLAVKAVVDRVDAMGRARRRRMRWLRRFGWMLLEWCVLGVMWWVWLVVVVVRLGLGSVKAVVRGVKWFLWLN